MTNDRRPSAASDDGASDADKLRIFMNTNITMSRGKYAAHAVHAALTAFGVHPDIPVVVLGAKPRDIEAMRVSIHDHGTTELEPGTLTAGTDYVPREAAESVPDVGGVVNHSNMTSDVRPTAETTHALIAEAEHAAGMSRVLFPAGRDLIARLAAALSVYTRPDSDLDAIEARHRASSNLRQLSPDQTWPLQRALRATADDVPTLIARVLAAEAERDEALRRVDVLLAARTRAWELVASDPAPPTAESEEWR